MSFISWPSLAKRQTQERLLLGLGVIWFLLPSQLSALAQLPRPGSVDTNFVPQLTGGIPLVTDMLVQSDGKIIIHGYFETVGGLPRPGLARLNNDGSPDPSFQSPALFQSKSDSFEESLTEPLVLALQSDGKLLISKNFEVVNGLYRTNLVRLNPDGSVDSSFVPFFESSAGLPTYGSLIVQSDGRIIQGQVGNVGTDLVRLNGDGSLDDTFHAQIQREPTLSNPIPAWFVGVGLPLPDGKLLIRGSFDSINGVPRHTIARLDSNGTLDQSWNVAPNVASNILNFRGWVSQPDGKLLTGLNSDNCGCVVLSRLNSDGSLDPSFNLDSGLVPDGLVSLGVQSDGRILAATGVGVIGGNSASLYRLNSDGSLDSTFDVKLKDGTVEALVIQANGQILVAGSFTSINGVPRPGLARLNSGFNPPVFVGFKATKTSLLSTLATLEGQAYLLESSTNLVDWVTIRTNVATGPTLDLSEENALGSNRRFYRAMLR